MCTVSSNNKNSGFKVVHFGRCMYYLQRHSGAAQILFVGNELSTAGQVSVGDRCTD